MKKDKKQLKNTLGIFDEYDRNARKTGREIFLFKHEADPKKAVDIDGLEYKQLWPGAYCRGYFKFLTGKGV